MNASVKLLAITGIVQLSLALNACVNSSGTRVPGQTFAPTQPDHVQVLYQEPHRPFTVIGFVSVDASGLADSASIERKFQAVAATMGADAVVIDGLPKDPFIGVPALGKGRALRWEGHAEASH